MRSSSAGSNRTVPIIEIAGVCGAGKSSLARSIHNLSDHYMLDEPLRLLRLSHLPYVVAGLPGLSPFLRAGVDARRIPNRAEWKLLIYLMEWDRWLESRAGKQPGAMILDQGPIYSLARLGRTVPAVAATEPHGQWGSAVTEKWSRSLDIIVWLDAPNDVLWERLHDRSQDHKIKGQSKERGLAFIDSYRESYQAVLAAMSELGGPALIRYDTARMTSEEIALDLADRIPGHLSARRRKLGS